MRKGRIATDTASFSNRRGRRISITCAVLLLSGGAVPVASAVEPGAPIASAPTVVESPPVQVSRPLRSLPLAPRYLGPEKPARPRRKPAHSVPAAGWNDAATAVDPLLARAADPTGKTPSPTLSFEGQGNNCGCSPPDTVGAAGPSHYVQMVNATQLSVYDKSGTRLAGPTEFSSLWSSGVCASSSEGDPIAVYDSLANRWLLTQFYSNGVCAALSTTSDPTGTYNLYSFGTTEFPDYFKIGVWSDAYYMGANESNYAAYALNRTAMLAGTAATAIRFTMADPQNFLMPATVVGPMAPPAGAPGIFYTFLDNSYHGVAADRLDLFHFVPNFAAPASSTFTLAESVPVTGFTYTVCGFFTFNCIPQGGTGQKVDAVSEWPMWQLQYRNFGSGVERLVGNFSVDVGSDRSGIRWFDMSRSGAGAYALVQEGTHAPADGLHRFMGSIGINGKGGISLAYSASSASATPSIRYASRAAGDPVGTLQSEVTLQAGAGSQTGSNRWGDYSALTVDPADDCTFWFTTEYYGANASNNWKTRIGSFKPTECTVAPPSGASFHSVTPCRAVDTRGADGTFGGPALAAGAIRAFPLATAACGVPATAKAVAVNVTVTQPGAAGTVSIVPSDAGTPQTTTVAFLAGQTRAGSAVVGVAAGGQASVSLANGSASKTHVLIDVAGYFQ
ncbi:MAG: hypothetical protein IPP07_06070 [Holophagales bacterium]|nr:hypothetical protein [Holophagales bacterium]